MYLIFHLSRIFKKKVLQVLFLFFFCFVLLCLLHVFSETTGPWNWRRKQFKPAKQDDVSTCKGRSHREGRVREHKRLVRTADR